MAGPSAWPIKLENAAKLPPPLDVQLTDLLGRDEQMQELVAIPADSAASRRGAWERTRGGQVLALTNQRVIVGVQAVRPDEAPWVAFPYDTIISWEISQTLLYGRLDLSAELDGQVVRTRIEFNTVGTELIVAALAPLECATLGVSRASRRRIPAGIDLPFKFGNFLADALLPDEQIHDLVFQAAIVVPLFRFWRRLITPGTVIAGTDRRLLVIREEAKLNADRYGYSSLTLPRRWAGGLIIDDDGTWLTLHDSAHPDSVRLLVARSHAGRLWDLVATLRDAAAAPLPEPASERTARTF